MLENFITGLEIKATTEGRIAMRIMRQYASNHDNFSHLDNIKERAMEVDDIVQDYLKDVVKDTNQRKWLYNHYIRLKRKRK